MIATKTCESLKSLLFKTQRTSRGASWDAFDDESFSKTTKMYRL